MAIRKDVDYPGRWSAATTDYPMGEPKNRTTSTSKDGSYLEKKWIQDYEAFFGAILNEVGETPNGTVDTAQTSQLFEAMLRSIAKSKSAFKSWVAFSATGGTVTIIDSHNIDSVTRSSLGRYKVTPDDSQFADPTGTVGVSLSSDIPNQRVFTQSLPTIEVQSTTPDGISYLESGYMFVGIVGE